MARGVSLIRLLSSKDERGSRQGEVFLYGARAVEIVRDNLGAIRAAQASVYPGKDRIQFTITAALISFIGYNFASSDGITYKVLFIDWVTPVFNMKIGFYFLILLTIYVFFRSLTYLVLGKALAKAESFYVQSLSKADSGDTMDANAEHKLQERIKNANGFDCAVDLMFYVVVVYVSVEMFHIFTV